MWLCAILCQLTTCLVLAMALEREPQRALAPDHEESRPVKIAIVGAGIAGASAAYHLEQGDSQMTFDVHVYEKSPRVGGKVKSVDVPIGTYAQRVDTGAYQFSSDDRCVQDLIDETGLRGQVESVVGESSGTWDGAKLTMRSNGNVKPMNWKDWLRYAWRYGLTVNDVRTWLARARPSYRRLLGRWQYIYRPIAVEVDDLGLTLDLDNSAQIVLENLTSTSFLDEVVQPLIRARFGQDPHNVRGLAAIDALTPANTQSIPHGRTQVLIERLIKLSDSHLHLDSAVTRIQRSPKSRQYRLTVEHSHQGDRTFSHADFDAIILAAPLHQGNIEFDIASYESALSYKEFSTRHVTHFTSASRLSPAYFNLPVGDVIPQVIYTTISVDIPGPVFYSVEQSSVSAGRDGCLVETENMYRVLSKAALNDTIILALLGHSADKSLEDASINWIHREEWRDAVLDFDGRPVPDKIEIADRIYYAGLGDQLVSSLEMSCRLGVRTASLLYSGDRYEVTRE